MKKYFLFLLLTLVYISSAFAGLEELEGYVAGIRAARQRALTDTARINHHNETAERLKTLAAGEAAALGSHYQSCFDAQEGDMGTAFHVSTLCFRLAEMIAGEEWDQFSELLTTVAPLITQFEESCPAQESSRPSGTLALPPRRNAVSPVSPDPMGASAETKAPSFQEAMLVTFRLPTPAALTFDPGVPVVESGGTKPGYWGQQFCFSVGDKEGTWTCIVVANTEVPTTEPSPAALRNEEIRIFPPTQALTGNKEILAYYPIAVPHPWTLNSPQAPAADQLVLFMSVPNLASTDFFYDGRSITCRVWADTP